MRRSASLLLALAAAASLAGCGQANKALIPDDRASALQDTVDQIDSACSGGDVAAAQRAVEEANAQINELPAATDRKLRRNLRAWVNQVEGRLDRDCQGAEESPTPERDGDRDARADGDGDARADRDGHADRDRDADRDGHAHRDGDPDARHRRRDAGR